MGLLFRRSIYARDISVYRLVFAGDSTLRLALFDVRRCGVEIQMESATKHAGNYVIDGGSAITTKQNKIKMIERQNRIRIYSV